MTLGQRIQEGRTKLGLSQEALGEKLGVSRQAVSKWEADGAVPDTDKLIALSKLFGVSLNALLQVEEPDKGAAPAAPKGRKRLWHGLSALFAAALVLSNVLLWGRVAELEGQVADLGGQVADLRAVPAPAAPGLDPKAPLVTAFDFRLEHFDGGVQLLLDLTAAQVIEGMEVTFTAVTHDGRSETVEAEAKGSGFYTAEIVLYGLPETPISLSAAFSDGMAQYVQALVRIDSYSWNGYDWEPLWQA